MSYWSCLDLEYFIIIIRRYKIMTIGREYVKKVKQNVYSAVWKDLERKKKRKGQWIRVEGIHLHITCHNYKSPICLHLNIKYPVIYCCGFDRNSKPNQNQESCIVSLDRDNLSELLLVVSKKFPPSWCNVLFDICEP